MTYHEKVVHNKDQHFISSDIQPKYSSELHRLKTIFDKFFIIHLK
jgi:hypothetical protein